MTILPILLLCIVEFSIQPIRNAVAFALQSTNIYRIAVADATRLYRNAAAFDEGELGIIIAKKRGRRLAQLQAAVYTWCL